VVCGGLSPNVRVTGPYSAPVHPLVMPFF
jgi:hypothetical protein